MKKTYSKNKNKQKDPFKDLVLDAEEQELENAFARGEFKSVGNLEKRREELAEMAKNTLAKNKRINIRMREQDLIEIKKKAEEHGLPYQTLISTILHHFAR